MSEGNAVDNAVVAMLEAVTDKSVYLIRVPGDAGKNYVVVYPLTIPRGSGSWAQPEEDRDYRYQVTSVGADARQVRWLQAKIHEGFVSQGGSGYEHAIEPEEGIKVQWRLTDEQGAIVPSGDELFKSDDTYRVRIGR